MEEQEETLRAIRDGEVDALMVSTPEGEKVFTLKGAEQIYRIFIETMHEGALLLSPAGTASLCQHPLCRDGQHAPGKASSTPP